MLEDLDRLGPILAVMATAGLIIIADLVVPRGREARSRTTWLAGLALAGLAAAALWLVVLIARDRQASFFSDSMVLDNFSIFFMFLFIGVAAAVVVASLDYVERFGRHQAEFFALTLIATSGMMLLSGARDLVTIFVALELTTITQAILAGFLRDDRGSEAAIKYLLLGAMSSAVVLYGMAFLYGIAGTTRLTTTDGAPSIFAAIALGDDGIRNALIVSMVAIAAGFGFKMAVVPFQMWAPDVYQGSPTPVAAFLSVGSKAAAFAVVLRIFYEGFGSETFVGDDWKMLFAVLAAVSMTLGNVMALRQTNVRRLLGYSSIAQAGNLLIGVAAITGTTDGESLLGASGVVFFLATYAFTNLGAFFAVMAISRKTGSDEIADYGGMGRRAPIPAAVLAFCLVSLTGLPPTAGFWAKIYIFNAGVQADLVWLVVVGVLNTVVSAFYYLGVVRQMYLGEATSEEAVQVPPVTEGMLLVAAAGVAAVFIFPFPLIEAAQRAVNVFA
jgi:NADH-quinone oxidoreductase subunit N